MIKPEKINQLVKTFLESLPEEWSSIPGDIEKNINMALQNAFAKMDLVTRDEFDAQTKVLARTRERLQALEKELQELIKQQT